MTSLRPWELWVLIVAGGIVTYAIRASFILAEGHYSPPHWLKRLMPFVPIAMLTALILPDVALMNATVALSLANPKFWAAVVAVFVAARWRNVLLTIASGFVALTALRMMA